MNHKESKVMNELHEIREKHYERTKAMTFKELADSINKKAERIMHKKEKHEPPKL